jgi:hypothetical protein
MLTNLGAAARADFYHILAAWQNDWLPTAAVSRQDWLATDQLRAEVADARAPLADLLDLQRFLTAGFLPSVHTPRQESMPADAADPAHSAAAPAAQGRATNAAPFQFGGGSAARYPQPSRTVATHSAPVPDNPMPDNPMPTGVHFQFGRGSAARAPAASPPMTPPQRPPTASQTTATPPGARIPSGISTSSPDPELPDALMPDILRSSGLRALAQDWTSLHETPQQQARDPKVADAPLPWAPPPTRAGGLRDLAQRLPAAQPTPWIDQPTAPADAPWPTDDPWPTDTPDAPRQRADAPSPLPAPHSSPKLGSGDPSGARVGPPSLPDLGRAGVGSPSPTWGAGAPPGRGWGMEENWMDALAREITREYHRFYGA